MNIKTYAGPEQTVDPKLRRLAEGVWLTCGRTVVLLGINTLALIDPGDEPILAGTRAIGPLADALGLSEATGKPIGLVLVTHAHPDHVANLPALIEFARGDPRFSRLKIVAHADSPLRPDLAIATETALEELDGLRAIPLVGHSPYGDDLAFYHQAGRILFSGDIVQPKGESWSETFYPSPYPYFTDGDRYAASLEKLLALPFETLVTGHREVRFHPAGRRWVELTRRAILAVEKEVADWRGPRDPLTAGKAIYRKLCLERGIDEAAIAARMSPEGDSAFDRYDMPGILHYWKRLASHG